MMQEQEKYYASFSEVIPHLFIGNSDSAYDKNILQLLSITHVLIVGSQLQIKHGQQYSYKKINIQDSVRANLLDHLQQGINFIESSLKSNGSVLVHCRFGISRSSAFVIGYLMKTKKQPFMVSYKQVKHKRDIIKPNSGFVKQLMKYQTQLNLTK